MSKSTPKSGKKSFSFSNIPYRKTMFLVWLVAIVAALIVYVEHAGFIAEYVPDTPLNRWALGGMAAAFITTVLTICLRAGLRLDQTLLHVQRVKTAFEAANIEKHEKIARLFSGDILNRNTLIGRYIRDIAIAKFTNVKHAVDLDNFSGRLAIQLDRDVGWVRFMSGMLVTLGLLGTFLGIAVGLKLDFASLGDVSDIGAIIKMLGGVTNGVSTAVMTSIIGLFSGAVILAILAKYLGVAVEEAVNGLDVLFLKRILPLINDPEEMAVVIEHVKKRDYQSFVGEQIGAPEKTEEEI